MAIVNKLQIVQIAIVNKSQIAYMVIVNKLQIAYMAIVNNSQMECEIMPRRHDDSLVLAVVKACNEDGMTITEAARKFGLHTSTVYLWTQDRVGKIKLREQVCDAVKGGMQKKAVAQTFGVNKNTVTRWVDDKKRPYKAYLERTDEIIDDLINKGMSYRDAAKKYHTNYKTLRTIADKNEVRKKEREAKRNQAISLLGKMSLIEIGKIVNLSSEPLKKLLGDEYKDVDFRSRRIDANPARKLRSAKEKANRIKDDNPSTPKLPKLPKPPKVSTPKLSNQIKPKATVPKLPDAPRFKSIKTPTPPPAKKVNIPARVEKYTPSTVTGTSFMGLGKLTALMAPPGVREAIKGFLVDNFIGGGVDSAWNESKVNGPKRIRVKISNSKSKLIADSDGEPITLNFDTEGQFLGYDQSASTQQKKPLLYNSAMSL